MGLFRSDIYTGPRPRNTPRGSGLLLLSSASFPGEKGPGLYIQGRLWESQRPGQAFCAGESRRIRRPKGLLVFRGYDYYASWPKNAINLFQHGFWTNDVLNDLPRQHPVKAPIGKWQLLRQGERKLARGSAGAGELQHLGRNIDAPKVHIGEERFNVLLIESETTADHENGLPFFER